MKSPLHSIYIFRQADKNESKKLSETSAFSRLMNICIHHDKDELLVNNLMESLHNLISHIPVYEVNSNRMTRWLIMCPKTIADSSGSGFLFAKNYISCFFISSAFASSFS